MICPFQSHLKFLISEKSVSKMGSIQTDQPSLLPLPHSTTLFWRTDLHELENYQSTEHLPAECDILMIGGGYASITRYPLAVHDQGACTLLLFIDPSI
jgi:hypothetical protein